MVLTLKATEIEGRLRNSKRGNSIELNGSLIGSGEFILYGIESNLVGQVICIEDYRDIDKWERSQCRLPRGNGAARYALVRQIELKEGVSNPEPDPHKYTMLPKILDEAIPTATVAFIAVEQVKSIAYLFHIDDIQAGRYNPGGLANGYAVRRYRGPNGTTRQLNPRVFKSFHNETSYSKRMWDAQVAIREESKKALSSRGQWDGRTKHLHLKGFNVEVYMHLHSIITEGFNGELIEKKDKGTGWAKPQKVMNPDLSNEHKRLKQKSRMVRALDEPSMKRFKGALGTTFAVANPTPVPKLKDIDEGTARPNVPLKDHTILRIATCKEDDKDNDVLREVLPIAIASSNLNLDTTEDAKLLAKIERQKHAKRCPFPGVDMEYTMGESGLTDLHFCIKFKKMRGDSEAVRDLI